MKLNKLKYIAGLTAIISLMAGSSLCAYAGAEAQAEAKADDELTVWEELTLDEIKNFASVSSNKHLKAAVAHLEMYED